MEAVEVDNENLLQSLIEEPEPSYARVFGNDTSDVSRVPPAIKKDTRMLSTPASSFLVGTLCQVCSHE